MSDLRGVSRDLGECSTHCLASFRLPLLDLGAERFVSIVDERPNRLRVRDREDELHVSPAEGFDLGDGGWNARLRDFRLADSTQSFAEQCLDGLDPGTVIWN